MREKIKVFLTSTVFREMGGLSQVSPAVRARVKALWDELAETCDVTEYPGRFPAPAEVEEALVGTGVALVGCHLSHPLPADLLARSEVVGVCTSTAGFNHVGTAPGDPILVTHTPGVLHETVADYTIAVIMANLRNLVHNHNYVWAGQWTPDERWDLDQKLCRTVDALTLGIVGMGEIGQEVTRKLTPWGVRVVYYDPVRKPAVEERYPGLVEYAAEIGEVFARADVVSLHLPLNDKTRGLVGETLLRQMKPGALLVNTARGPVVDFEALLHLLETGAIAINLAFDVFDPEPIAPEVLARFKAIARAHPERGFVFNPHNASANADTRGEMAAMLFEDLLRLARARSWADLAEGRLIPRHQRAVDAGETDGFRINAWFSE